MPLCVADATGAPHPFAPAYVLCGRNRAGVPHPPHGRVARFPSNADRSPTSSQALQCYSTFLFFLPLLVTGRRARRTAALPLVVDAETCRLANQLGRIGRLVRIGRVHARISRVRASITSGRNQFMFATQEKQIQINAHLTDAQQAILSEEAIRFVSKLARAFEPRPRQLLAGRRIRQQEIDGGALPVFLPSTAHIRNSEWQVAPVPADLLDRRVEITGPVDRKMIINALNSGASVFMADFEDSNSPTWNNNIEGQHNLRDAIRGTIAYESPEGKKYELGERTAVLMVRPRGWHLDEKHFLVDGEPISASLFDFGLFFFHNAKALISNGTGPYFYLPKLENHLEARLWNDVFLLAQQEMGISRGTIRATVLIETILAAFEMDEILWELREHSAGLNCGRWDYIFSFIKKFGSLPGFVLPDRAQVAMDRHFLRSYVDLLIQTCHRRGIHAMGGMAAQIPIKNDPEANRAAVEKVRQDKLREV